LSGCSEEIAIPTSRSKAIFVFDGKLRFLRVNKWRRSGADDTHAKPWAAAPSPYFNPSGLGSRIITETDIQCAPAAGVKEPERTGTCCPGNLLPISLNPRVSRR